MIEQNIRVLVVDDEESFRKPLAERLQGLYNYHVREAATGSEALHLLATQGRCDVALIDQVLEGDIGGLELLKQVKSEYPDTQVIVFTGWPDKMQEEGVDVLRQGAYRYFAKPFNLEELALTIRFAAEQRQIRREREYLSALVQVSHDLTTTTDMEKQLAFVWNFVQERLAAATFFIALYDSETDALRFPLSFDEGELDPLPERHLGEDATNWGLAGYVVKNIQELTWNSYEQAEQEWQSLEIQPHVTEKGPSETGICLPLQVGEKVLGALSVQSYQSHAFDQAFLDAVRTLSSHLAPAIENARLFSDLEKTSYHLEGLIESSLDAVISIDHDKHITVFNQQAEEMFGYTANEMRGSTVAALYPDIDEANKIWGIVDKQGSIVGHEVELKHKKGTKIPVLVSAFATKDTRGNKIGQAGFLRDLRQVQLLEERLRAVIKASQAIRRGGIQDVDQVLQLIVESAIAAFPAAEKGSIHIFDEKTEKLQISANFGYNKRVVKALTLKPGEGFAGWVHKHGDPIISGNVWDDKRYKEIHYPETRKQKSSICTPLKFKSEVIGALTLDNLTTHDAFTSDDLELFSTFADQAAIAIGNTQLFEESKKNAERLEALRRTTLAITSLLEREKLLDTIVQQAVNLLEAKSGGIYEYYPEWGELTIIADYGRAEDLLGNVLRIGEGMAGRLVLSGKTHMIVDNYNTWSGKAEIYGDHRLFESVLEVPLKWGDDIIGVLYVDDERGRKFNLEDVQLLSLFAEQAAIAFTNAELIAKDEEKLKRLEMLSKITGVIMSELGETSLDERLTLIAKHATRILEAKVCGIYLVKREGILRAEASYGHPEGRFKKGTKFEIQSGPGTGITGHIAHEGKLLNLHGDAFTGHHAARIDETRICYSLLGVPLKRKVGEEETLVGVLRVEDKKGKDGTPHESVGFTEEDEWIVNIFAEAVVVAIDSAKLVNQLQEQKDHVSLLLKATNTVAQAKNLDAGLQSLAEMMVTSLTETFCHILLLDENQQHLESKAAFPIPRPKSGELCWNPRIGQRIPLSEWVEFDEIRKNERPIVIRSNDECAQTILREVSKYLELHKTLQSLLVIPLRTGDKIVGLLNLGEMREWTRSPFTLEKQELATAIAGQTAILIERRYLHEITERRSKLLETLEEASRHIRAEKEPAKLLHETVRLAAELMECAVSGLFINHSHLGELELTAAHGLPVDILNCQIPHDEGLIGSVAKTGETSVIYEYSNWDDREAIFESFSFSTVVGIPLKHVGEVVAVLFVADGTNMRQCDKDDLEILERFAAQASIALHASQLMNKEQRRFSQLAILHRISDYIQEARDLDKILHVVLTGITAGYGLGFNRAILLLLDEREKNLIGRMGIGHLSEREARKDWVQHGFDDYEQYLQALEEVTLIKTPLEERSQKLRLATGSELPDIFSRSIQEQQWKKVEQLEVGTFPKEFITAFEPALPLVVVPIIAQEKALGVLVVDNKFNRAPITSEDIDLLLTFANTVALAIDNVQLYQETEAAREKIRTSFEASNKLVMSQTSKQLLMDVIEQIQMAAGASWVSIVLVDEMRRVKNLLTTGTDKEVDISDVIRPEGITMQVMSSGEAVVIEDTQSQRQRVNPRMFRNKVGAALCLPFSVQGKQIGVMWIHYDAPCHFPEYDSEALQLYVNQAAVAYDNNRRLEEMEHIRQAAETLSGVAGLHEVLEQIVCSARDILQADSAAIWSYDDIQHEFIAESLVAVGIPTKLLNKLREEERQPGRTADAVMGSGWIGVSDVSDFAQYPFIGEGTRNLFSEIKTQSFQGLAITVGDEKLGVLYVNYNYPRSFSEEEQETAKMFANHAALALKKEKLLEQMNNARNTAKVVAEVTTLENLNETLVSVANGTKDVLKCDAVVVYVYDSDNESFTYPPITEGVRFPEKTHILPAIPGGSIVLEMMSRKEMHIVENVAKDSLFKNRRFAREEEIVSCVAVPLIVADRRVGVMFINYRSPYRFTEDEVFNIELFANQAAVAIRNAQLYDQERKRAGALEALYQAGQVVTGSLELENILNRIAEQAWTLTSETDQTGGFSNIRLIEGTKAKLVAAYPQGELSRIKEEIGNYIDLVSERDRKGIIVRAINTQEPQLVGDVSDDPDFLETHPETRSELAVPIYLEEKTIGAINIESPQLNGFDKQDEKTLEALAAQAAIAIQNAWLHEKIIKRAEALASLYDAGKAITSTLALDETLQRIVERALRIVRPTYEQEEHCFGHVALVENHKLRFIAASPTEVLADLQRVDIDLRESAQIGITGRAASNGKPQNVPNVEKDTDYIPLKETTRSQLSVPLKIGERITGILSIEHPEYSAFSEEDQHTLDALTTQAAVAIENARLYEAEQQHAKSLEAIQATSAAVSAVLELDILLPMITDKAAEIFGAPATALMLWDEPQENLVIRAAFGLSDEYQQGQKISRYTVDQIVAEKRLKPQVFDIRIGPIGDPKLVESEGLYNVLVAPLTIDEGLIGVLNVYSIGESRQFEEREKEIATIFANHATIAIQNAHSYEELKRTKGLVGARTALAWMGMASSAWRHTIEGYAINIRNTITLMRQDIQRSDLTTEQQHLLENRLVLVDSEAAKVLEKPITPPLYSEENSETILINDLIRERVSQLWEDDFYQNITPHVLLAKNNAKVKVSPEWLRRALDILIDNAVEAMTDSSERKLTIETRLAGSHVEIVISDTGKGIPFDLHEKLFKEPIEKPEYTKGFGMGLLMVQAIMQAYGGDACLESSEPGGTAFVVSLPIEQ